MDWKQTAAALVREVAADDLAAHEVRILEPSELGIIAPAGIGGWFGLASYELLNCDPAAVALLVVDGSKFDTDLERVGAVLHEFCHWLDFGRELVRPSKVLRPRTARERDLLELKSRLLAAIALRDLEATPDTQSDVPRWHQHGTRFVIAAAVLAYRAGEIIEAIRPRHLRFSSDYSGVPESSWAAVLGDEVERGGSIASIIAGRPPEAFCRAWRSITGEALG
jgi:hypothetical protein